MKKVFPLDLDGDLHRRLKHAAIDAGLTLQAFIIRALQEQVDREGIRPPRGTRKDDQPANRGR